MGWPDRALFASALLGLFSITHPEQALAAQTGELEKADCDGIVGWAADDADKEGSLDVRLTFDGAAGDAGAVFHSFAAATSRSDLCSMYGCDHGFTIDLPLSLFDGKKHSVHAYASDGTTTGKELKSSPGTFTCPMSLPTGTLRPISPETALSAWHFSAFWDEISVSDGIVGAYSLGPALPDVPEAVHTDADPTLLYLIDRAPKGGKLRRSIKDPATQSNWYFSPVTAKTISADDLAQLDEGPPLRDRPFVFRTAEGNLFLVDDDLTPASTSTSQSSSSASTGGAGADGASSASSGSAEGGGKGTDSSGSCACSLPREQSSFALSLAPLALIGGLGARRRFSRARTKNSPCSS